MRNGSIRSTTSVISAMSIDDQPDLTFLLKRSLNEVQEDMDELYSTTNDTLLSITEELEEESPARKGLIDESNEKREEDGKQTGESLEKKKTSVGNGFAHHGEEKVPENKQNGSAKITQALEGGGGAAAIENGHSNGSGM
jgi:hypothetical protein